MSRVFGFPDDQPIRDVTEFDGFIASQFGISELMEVQQRSQEGEIPRIMDKSDLRKAFLIGYRRRLVIDSERFKGESS